MYWHLKAIIVLVSLVSILPLTGCGNSAEDELDECQKECERINENPSDGRICLGCRLESRQRVSTDAAGASSRGFIIDLAVETDLNHDGTPDLVTTDATAKNVSVLLNNADGTPQAWQTFPIEQTPDDLSVDDVNGDGHADMVVSSVDSAHTSVLLGVGDGSFQPAQVWPPAQY